MMGFFNVKLTSFYWHLAQPLTAWSLPRITLQFKSTLLMLMLKVAQLTLLLLMLFPVLFVRKLKVMMLSIVSLNKMVVSSFCFISFVNVKTKMCFFFPNRFAKRLCLPTISSIEFSYEKLAHPSRFSYHKEFFFLTFWIWQ